MYVHYFFHDAGDPYRPICHRKKNVYRNRNDLKQDYYLLSSVRKIETILATNSETVNSGSFEFYDGHADFQIKKKTDTILEINIQLMTGKKLVIIGMAYYDTGKQKVIQWIERS